MNKKTNGVHLKINQLRKTFGNVDVLKGIDIEISPGEFVAIVGKSGCGKSTLLRHVAGLEEESSGSILQEGKKIKGPNKKARFMFQDDRLLPWVSVLENVGVGLGLKKNWKPEAESALEQVGLKNRAGDWPFVLSGGQKQRVALARALAARPKLLLLDEPLGALDALTRIEMQALVEKLWLEQGYTSLLVTHDVSEAIALADRVILIEEGVIKMDVNVTLPRPRQRSHPLFAQLEEKVLANVLGQENVADPLLQRQKA
jgi:sulfonate transport system ATP-binding protein